MKKPRKVPLNACDFVIFSQHRVWHRTTGGGNFPYMMVDIEGEVDSSHLQQSLQRALSAHPVLLGGLRTAALRFRPFWVLPVDAMRVAEQTIVQSYFFVDLRNAANFNALLEELCQARYSGEWYCCEGPQVCLEHYSLPGARTRLVLRWPHYAMDAEGAQQFLASLGDDPPTVAGSPEDASSILSADDDPPRVLGSIPLYQRPGIIRRGFRARRELPDLGPSQPLLHSRGAFGDYAVLHRHWHGQPFGRMRDDARRLTPPGPASFSRFLAAAVCRAQRRLFEELKHPANAFFITFPMRVGTSEPTGRLFDRRPLIGNYLVAPTISVLAEETRDRALLSDVVLQQVQQFLSARGDIAQWALLELASLWHAWLYHWIFKLPLSVNQCSSGFSYYAEIKNHLTSIAGAKVVNIYGGGPTTTPPAWNPVFSKFADNLNLSLTYSRPAMSDEWAVRYADLIEDELVNPA